jgi:probable F420-dependent oxidoreductase
MTGNSNGISRQMKIGLMPGLEEAAFNGRTPRFRDIRALALAAEQAGFDSFWLADHFIARFPNQEENGQWEVFTFLSGIAAVTSRISLGPLVACTSFREPTLLAKMADSLDEMSDGRFILGLGAGWHEPEYTAFGFPFDHRAGRFEESLQIILPLLKEGHVDFTGRYYQARDCVLRPRGPSRGGPPIWIGAGRPRMLKLVAQHADAWNTVWHLTPERVGEEYARMLDGCRSVGRDPATLELTAGTVARVLAPGESPKPGEKSIAGTAEEVAERLLAFSTVGVTHLVVQVEPSDLSGVERFAAVLERLDTGNAVDSAG